MKAAHEIVRIEGKKIAELEDQIRKARDRKGLDVKKANNEKEKEKELLQELEQLGNKHEDAVEREQSWTLHMFLVALRLRSVRRCECACKIKPRKAHKR